MTYYVYPDTQHRWRWQLRAANNKIIADSAEAYFNKADCLAGINLVKGSAFAAVRYV